MKTDVLVVGAGPAGSCTAREIAEKGYDVLAIDRRKEIGYPVQCGEFIPTQAELKRILPRSEEFGDLFILEKGAVQRSTKTIELLGPKGIAFKMMFDGYTVDRREFDKSLWRRAEKAGAKLMTGVEFQSLVRKGVARTTSGEISYKVIVGADGPLSRVRKSFLLPEPSAMSQAITAQAKGDFGDSVKMYFGTIAPGGYAWIIPKSGSANVGLGIQKRFCGEPLSRLFDSFVKSMELDVSEIQYGQVPVSGPIGKTACEDMVLVGDAAGQVMATNGGGIPIAMMCGRIAGRTVAEHLSGRTDLMRYDSEWKRQMWRPLRNAARTKRMADFFFSTDKKLAFAMRVLGERGLERAILCRKVFYAF